MKRFNGGTKVQGGYYLHLAKWEVVTVTEDVGTLPGGPKDQYLHASLPLLLLLAPVMGGLFAIFLPFLGFAMPVWALGKKLSHLGARAAHDAAATMTPAWQPGVAYLADKQGEKGAKDATPQEPQAPAVDPRLAKLGKEIAQRLADDKKSQK